MSDDIKISYDLKEVLERMGNESRAGFERLERGLAKKADKSDIERLGGSLGDLRGEVGDLRERVGELEGARHEDELLAQHAEKSLTRRQKWIRAAWIVGTTIALIAATAGWLH